MTDFVYAVKVLTRERGVLIWAVAFPLVLTTLFGFLFTNLDQTYRLDPLPVVLVEDAGYAAATGFAELIDQASQPGANGDEPLLAPRFVATEDAARQALADGGYLGYVVVDGQGRPSYRMDSRQIATIDTLNEVRQAVVLALLDGYTQSAAWLADLAATDPERLSDPALWAALTDQPAYTRAGSVTDNPPSDSVRYFYAALAFASIMTMIIGTSAIHYWKADTSGLGARRCLGGHSWSRSLAPTLLAAWLLAWACVRVGFGYMRHGFGVDFGGKLLACEAVIVVATGIAVLLGAALGALPIVGGAKFAFGSLLATFLSIFAGLYGPGTQRLGDYVAQHHPVLSALNPVRQVYEAFNSLYNYDSYQRLGEIMTVLAIMALVLFLVCVAVLRRQQYRSL